MIRESLVSDFSPFADIGEAQPKFSQDKEFYSLKMVRNGHQLKISVSIDGGKVNLTIDAKNKKQYASIAALLASEQFANLRKWADSQKELLRREAAASNLQLPINGKVHTGETITTVEAVSDLIGGQDLDHPSTEILLIDGPAGIGKTNLIEQLAFRRATFYKDTGQPVILHVKSRGRVLSNLQDLMAFSLQTIRSHITYDQIPVLAKYGLVIIAIDGFDELGDPNGYEMAWAQLGDLVNQIRDKGKLILAGRDTFLGRERLVRDVVSIKKDIDVVSSLTLDAPTSSQARSWLGKHKWTPAQLDSAAMVSLLEDDSFALRPVFLRLLIGDIRPKQLLEKRAAYITTMLIDSMIKRESKLFGKAVESVMPSESLEKFIWEFMHEVAREMADSQTETMEASALGWIAEIALGDSIDSEITSLIKNRAAVIAFLIQDERPGYLTFMHSQIMNYFLSNVTLKALEVGDIPKFVRRNLFGPEFLLSFIDASYQKGAYEPEVLQGFLNRALNFSFSYGGVDRGTRNVGALLIAALPYAVFDASPIIRNYDIDDAIARGTYPSSIFKNITISQLDCRGADFKSVNFEDVVITSVIADDATRFCPSFPQPAFITDGDGFQVPQDEISHWLESRGKNADELTLNGIVPIALQKHAIYSLLGRACRLRQYWLRLEDDQYAEKILRDPDWVLLSEVLLKHDFIKVEVRAASGRSPTFYHIKHRDRILGENPDDDAVKALFQEMATLI